MEFRTHVKREQLSVGIDYRQRGLSIGSCFADNIARRMVRLKLPVINNPFGVVYNPMSIADGVERLVSGRHFTPSDLVQNGGLWSNFSFHGSFSSTDAQSALDAMNRAVDGGTDALRRADYVIITFGSAWVYELATNFEGVDGEGKHYNCHISGNVVANCHKFPPTAFLRRRLSVEEIVARYDALLDGALNNKRIVMTVSPVMHVKDGAHQNTLSKSTLLLAIERLAARHPNVEYFPAFEIMNYELRDYRFYADDMVHPSQLAVEYIWRHFCEVALSPDTMQSVSEVDKIVTASEHRPLNPHSAEHLDFMVAMRRKVEAFQTRHPEIDLSRELECFSV